MIHNSVLREIYETGRVTTRDGVDRAATENGMPKDEGEMLYKIVCKERPRTTLEVGMAFGLSTMFICQALFENEGRRHIVMDPNQEQAYDSIGLLNITRSGFDELVEFHQESSHRVLPRLESAGTVLDFAFVDGVHLFDFTLVEFFYIDRMLRPGGLIVFDDLQLPAVRKVTRYALRNRGYSDESLIADTGTMRRFGRRAKRFIRGLSGLSNALMFAVAGEREESLCQEIAYPRANGLGILRKTSADNRDWRHFVDF
jgi:predicted O-methyltransferase YrrM